MLGIAQSELSRIRQECESQRDSELYYIDRRTLISIIDELSSLRRVVVAKSPPLDPKAEDRIKYLEQFARKLEEDFELIRSQMAGLSTRIGEIETGSGQLLVSPGVGL